MEMKKVLRSLDQRHSCLILHQRMQIDKCLELTAYEAQYRIPLIVFDRDQMQGFDEIIVGAERKGIQVGCYS